MRQRIALGLAAVVAVGAVVAAAGAGHVAVPDPNDTKGLLDVRQVDVKGAKRPRWKVITFARWKPVDIFDTGFTLVQLDTFGSARPDYYALVSSNGFRLRGALWRDRAVKRDYKVSDLRVWRAFDRSLSVRVPLRKLRIGKKRVSYRWFVETLFTSDRCRAVCIDRVPDDGRVAEPLPLPTPSETPSPIPTETPSPTPSE